MSSGMGASGADGGSGTTGDPRPTRVPLHRGASAWVAGFCSGFFLAGTEPVRYSVFRRAVT